MGSLPQKKFSISHEHKQFLDDYAAWGFSDQSSVVREALDRFIKEVKTKERKRRMATKAKQLLTEYAKDRELIVFTDLDAEEFL